MVRHITYARLVFLFLVDKQKSCLFIRINIIVSVQEPSNTRVILFTMLSFVPPEEVILHRQNDKTSFFRNKQFKDQN